MSLSKETHYLKIHAMHVPDGNRWITEPKTHETLRSTAKLADALACKARLRSRLVYACEAIDLHFEASVTSSEGYRFFLCCFFDGQVCSRILSWDARTEPTCPTLAVFTSAADSNASSSAMLLDLDSIFSRSSGE